MNRTLGQVWVRLVSNYWSIVFNVAVFLHESWLGFLMAWSMTYVVGLSIPGRLAAPKDLPAASASGDYFITGSWNQWAADHMSLRNESWSIEAKENRESSKNRPMTNQRVVRVWGHTLRRSMCMWSWNVMDGFSSLDLPK